MAWGLHCFAASPAVRASAYAFETASTAFAAVATSAADAPAGADPKRSAKNAIASRLPAVCAPWPPRP